MNHWTLSRNAFGRLVFISAEGESSYVGTGACVKDSILQWGTRVDTHALSGFEARADQTFLQLHNRLWRHIRIVRVG